MRENEIAKLVLDQVLVLHREYGPGLFESVYEKILLSRLRSTGLKAERQVPIYLNEEGLKSEIAFRMDIVVNEKLILELKSIEKLTKLHRMQLLTYLRLSKLKLGLLINFNTEYVLREGMQKVVNGL
ncbi:MAG: GxxExxY protein [Bacteroidota bacterium]